MNCNDGYVDGYTSGERRMAGHHEFFPGRWRPGGMDLCGGEPQGEQTNQAERSFPIGGFRQTGGCLGCNGDDGSPGTYGGPYGEDELLQQIQLRRTAETPEGEGGHQREAEEGSCLASTADHRRSPAYHRSRENGGAGDPLAQGWGRSLLLGGGLSKPFTTSWYFQPG